MATDKARCCFKQYFRENYLQNYKKWAYCYRKNLGINTNMRLESMHKTLKYLYLDGKKVKRLDKGHFALNKFIQSSRGRKIKRTKGKNNCYIKDINERHRGAQNKD
ncbi:unnamed protein product [Psylliodes chrysocephalus]|uniref:Uncharacterized protein n=1 Tax=Psylliodes chrysocephalus TaxID=3402493 RepID=A0A9P0CUP0_9CUCU|nr:unnamed protein product [Psylliodes chrysocephala]